MNFIICKMYVYNKKKNDNKKQFLVFTYHWCPKLYTGQKQTLQNDRKGTLAEN